MFLQIILQSITLRKTGLLKNSIKLFPNKVESYCFLKFMSGNGMSTNLDPRTSFVYKGKVKFLWGQSWVSTKENTSQLSPQFPNTSSPESESETEYSSFKNRRKHLKENEVTPKVSDNHFINFLSNALHSCQSTPCHFCNYVIM